MVILCISTSLYKYNTIIKIMPSNNYVIKYSICDSQLATCSTFSSVVVLVQVLVEDEVHLLSCLKKRT